MINREKNRGHSSVAKDFKQKSSADITDDIEFLSESIDTDIRENLPPQMLAVVSAVISIIEEL